MKLKKTKTCYGCKALIYVEGDTHRLICGLNYVIKKEDYDQASEMYLKIYPTDKCPKPITHKQIEDLLKEEGNESKNNKSTKY